MLGFLQAVYALEGAETAAQVAEEAKRADWLAPLGIASSIAGSWLIGVICESHTSLPRYHADLQISSRCSSPFSRSPTSSGPATLSPSVSCSTTQQDPSSPSSSWSSLSVYITV